jgi:hypothetical protein
MASDAINLKAKIDNLHAAHDLGLYIGSSTHRKIPLIAGRGGARNSLSPSLHSHHPA